MNKFYNLVLLVMSWLFLVAAVVILINLLFMTNGEMKAMGVTMVGARGLRCRPRNILMRRKKLKK